MVKYKSFHRRCVALAGAAAIVCFGTLAASASADPYGEIGMPFGKAHEAEHIEPGFINYQGVHAFAVDPSDDSVYIGDEAEPEITAGKEFKRFRLQKFSSSGELLGSASFRLTEHEHSVNQAGIAVDPTQKHVYVLVVDEREKEPDAGPAAGALYGFSTEPSGKALESVVGHNIKGEPLPLTGEAVFKPQGKAKEALLKPGGIAVDPITHDVVIAGSEDVNNEEELDAVVARVHENGELGNRSVDDTNCLLGSSTSGGEPECGHAGGEPISPVVDPSGKVYVRVAGQGGSEIWQIPTPESEALGAHEFKTLPKQLFALPAPSHGANLVSFGFWGEGEGEEPRGSSMSLVPEGEREGKGVGRIYVNAEIQQDEEEGGKVKAGGGFPYPGAIAFGYTENKATGVLEGATEEGWVGGPALGPKCELEAKGGVAALVGGGKEKGVLVFAFGEQPNENIFTARVSRFGPGGEGCTHARLTNAGSAGIRAAANTVEKPVFSTKDSIVLSSEVFQADALSVRWEIENTATHAKQEHLAGDEFQTTSVSVGALAEGEYKVREAIKTDDLASPVIEASRSLIVQAHPTARISGSESITAGETDALEGHLTNPVGGSLQYVWEFGDGTSASGNASVSAISGAHAYESAGGYTVKLKVTDSEGHTGEASFHVQVNEPAPPPQTSSTTTTPPASSTNTAPPTPTPSGGVQSYRASFAGNSLSVNAKGALVIKVDCSGQSSCSGTVTLRTLSAVSARKRKAILTLASGSFSVAAGRVASVTLHLSAKARSLLARSHVLRVRATIVGHASNGGTHITEGVVTLRAARKRH